MSNSGTRQAIAQASLAEYFQHRLDELMHELEPPLQEDTRWYLSTLLDRFSRTDRLFGWEDNGYNLRPLALLYGDARAAANEHHRCQLLQQLGDSALFLGALFPRRYARKGIGQDYFVGMGGGAYDYLASNARRGRHVFEELATSFAATIALVAKICRDDADDDADIVTLYNRWMNSGDEQIAQQLRRLGIDVNAIRH